MNKFRNLIIFTFGILFISCEKEIEYNGDDSDPLLVVNAIVENDSTISVNLEHSQFFLDDTQNENNWVTSGALLTLTNVSTGSSVSTNIPVVDNLYQFPLKASANNHYKITVSHPSYPPVNAEMTSAPQIILSDVDTSSFTNSLGELRKKAILKWIDPPGKNYYFIRVFTFDAIQNSTYETGISCTDVSFEDASPQIEDYENTYDFVNFTDELFEGKSKTIEISFSTYFGNFGTNSPIYRYELISMNEETYKYNISARKGLSYGSSPFTEPVKIFNNINNGFGIFGSFNRSIIKK